MANNAPNAEAEVVSMKVRRARGTVYFSVEVR